MDKMSTTEQKRWYGQKTCDFCGKQVGDVLIDGAVRGSDGWAVMCQRCHQMYGEGLGDGVGQIYRKDEDGNFVEYHAGVTTDETEVADDTEESDEEEFEYDDSAYYLNGVLQELHNSYPEIELFTKALGFVGRFLEDKLTDDDESFVLTISHRENDECRYVSFDLYTDSLSISMGGSVMSDAGSDTYGGEVWNLEQYGCAGYCEYDVATEALALLNMGAVVEEE